MKRYFAAYVAGIARSGRRVQIGSTRGQRCVHVGHFALQQLKLANRLAERFPHVSILKGHVARRLHQTVYLSLICMYSNYSNEDIN